MKKVLVVVCFLLFSSSLLFSYEYIMNAGSSFGTAWTSTKITSLTGGNWDDGYYDLALPALNQFYFYGKKVTHIRIWTNGYVTFGFGSAPTDYADYTNDSIPSLDNPNGYAAPWWDDWDLTSKGEIWYVIATNGVGANNWVTIEWKDVPHKNDPTASYDFQIIIFAEYHGLDTMARHSSIIFKYIDTDSGTGTYDFGKSGTIGIEHYTGSQCEKFGFNEAVLNNNLAILFTPFVPIYDMTDGWGDGYPDPVVWRPDNGMWYLRKYDGSITENVVWGTKGDIPLPGDYDGNGAWNRLVLRPSNYIWFNMDVNPFGIQWGQEGDIPVPADYDGNGVTDLAVFRPMNGLWFIYYLPSGTTAVVQWGTQGDVPLPADYDDDGKADCAVFRPGSNMWYIRKSSNPASPWIFAWGTDGDIPMPANFNSSSYATATVYRPSNGLWFHKNQLTGASLSTGPWGAEYDVPVPNDWNAGGITDECVFRPTDGMWYIEAYTSFAWGQMGDKPRCRRSFAIVAPKNFPVGLTDSAGNLIKD